ncbi:MAG: hypothetical protein HDQ88_07805 [Clostridia bacterium]|nr:hypothetical protein [Clostridia bacterium]
MDPLKTANSLYKQLKRTPLPTVSHVLRQPSEEQVRKTMRPFSLQVTKPIKYNNRLEVYHDKL